MNNQLASGAGDTRHKDAIAIFIKNPVMGKVKTRLAASIGDEAALNIYLRLIEFTSDVTREVEADAYIYYSEYIPSTPIMKGRVFNEAIQDGDDIGQRMGNCFKDLLRRYTRVLLIGSDCAALKADHINQAFRSLKDQDVVLGPAQDGGYYLIGMKTYHPTLFGDLPWSQKNLLKESVSTLSKDTKVHLLECLSDIDYLEDWNKVPWK